MPLKPGGAWKLTIEIETTREGRTWVATCPALNVSSHGSTKKESHEMLREALEGFFEDCIEHGTPWAALEQAGLIPTASSVVTTERPAGSKADWLDIPFWMLPGVRPEAALG